LTGFVLDASLTLAWHFFDEKSPETETLSERASSEGIVVPGHWYLEVANSLVSGERRKRTTIDLSARFVEWLDALSIEIDALDDPAIFSLIMPLARAHRLSVYDSLYLELAERRGLALATLDGELAAAAKAIGVEILP
jgi:predicted nucleic acid-binding protein